MTSNCTKLKYDMKKIRKFEVNLFVTKNGNSLRFKKKKEKKKEHPEIPLKIFL